MPSVGSLFSGVGGFDMGFERAGFTVAWQCEIDRDAVSVLERHWPDTERYGDICEVTALPCLSDWDGGGLDAGKRRLNIGPRMGESVAIRAEDDGVIKGVHPAVPFGDEVVGVAGSLSPTTPHARVPVPAANGLHPGRLGGVGSALRDDVGSALVPRHTAVAAGESLPVGETSRRMHTGTVAELELPSGSVGRPVSDLLPAPTSTRDHIHGKDYTVTSPSHLSPVDVIIGGFPCQDLSVAGKREGLTGARSGLYWEAVRIVREMREATGGRYPAFVVLENVPGLLSAGGGRDFAAVLGGLRELGAAVGYRILDARFFGVPQRRRRVFIVAAFPGERSGAERAAQVLFEPQSGSRHPAPSRAAGESAARDAAGGAGVVGVADVPVANSVTASAGHHGHSGDRGDGSSNLIAVAISENQRAELRETPHVYSQTGGGGKPGQGYAAVRQGMAVRRLTPTECCRLMGWPDDWVTFRADGSEIPDGARYRCIGNGVVASVAAWIATRMLGVLEA